MHFEGMGRATAAAAIASALTACGGGGGGSSAEAPQAQRVVITQANAPSVAAEAIDAGGAGSDASGSVTGVQVSTTSPRVSVLASLASAVKLGLTSVAPNALVGATTTHTETCSNGGSVTVTQSYTTQGTATPGDRVDLAFNSCVEGTETLTGTLSVTLVSTSSGGKLNVVDATASAFTIATTGLGERLNGGMRITLDETSSATTAITLSGSSLSFDRLVNGAARATRTLSNYNYQLATTLATGTTSQSFSFTASGSFPRFGTVSFAAQTTQPIVTLAGAAHPSSGAGKVTGANGTSVTVTVISTGVRLDVDTNGDGTIDATLTRTWAELDAEL